MHIPGRLLLVVFTVLTLCFAGCRVSYSASGASVPIEAKTFSVEYFQNTAPLANPTYSQRLSEKLKDLLLAQTRLNLVKSNGDLQYSGTVILYEVAPNAIQGNQTAAFTRLRVRVRVNYINSFDPKQNFEKEIEQYADFEASKNFAAEEPALIEEINKKLVQDIFNASLGNW